MKYIYIIYFSILLSQINYISNVEPLESNENKVFDAVYRIDNKLKGFSLIVDKENVRFSTKKSGKEESFRIISTGNSYYIITKPFNQKIGLKDNDELKLYAIDDKKNDEKTKWNFIEIGDKVYLLQNLFNKKYVEIISKNDGNNIIYYPICTNDYNKDKNQDNFKYSFFKLCEEVKLNPEQKSIIDKEPVDVLIKYIDLIDKTLNRQGIEQIKKDEDNEELRYCVRSILQYIPWVRKIFILMPNEKVIFFKPINEIAEKFVYVKEKDLLGFDSANSVVFQLNLHKLEKFGITENFILMDDVYFFGKPVKKSDFFYYDEELEKVLPSVVTDDFTEMIKTEVIEDYNKLYIDISNIQPYSFNVWKISQLAGYKLLLENFESPLINPGFSHNAISLNINDLKEIHDLIVNKYQYAKEVLNSKIRTVYDLQPQSLFNAYALNVKKRKVNSIPYAHYDIASIERKNFDVEMFALNISRDREYTQFQIYKVRNILAQKFPLPTPFETEVTFTQSSKPKEKFDLSKYIDKNDYDALKQKYEELEKKVQNNNLKQIIDEKNNYIKNLTEEMENLIKKNYRINNLLNDYITLKYLEYAKNESKHINQEESLLYYIFLQSLSKKVIIILLIVIVAIFFYLKYKFKKMKSKKKENIIPLTEIKNEGEAFSKLPTE